MNKVYLQNKIILLPLLLFSTIINAQDNYALSFNGANGYVEVNNHNVFDLNAAFTVEAWIYPTGVGSDPAEGGILLNKEDSYEIARFADGSIRYALSANGTGSDWSWENTSLFAPLHQWSHIALVKNGTSLVVYLNGISSYISNTAPTNLVANISPLRIGARSAAGNQYFHGHMDEIRIWNSARTDEQIRTNVFNELQLSGETNLIAYYRMNEVAGAEVNNSSTTTSGTDGVLVNGTTRVNSPIQFEGNGLSFAGTNDFGIIPHPVSSDFTVEFWMKTTSPGSGPAGSQWYNGRGVVDAEVPGETNDWGTALINGKLAFGIGAPDVTIHSTSVVNTGNWVHVAVSWKQSNGEMRLYINGMQEASNNGSTASRSAPGRITLGRLQTDTGPYTGALDEVRIWNSVRSQAQIQAGRNNELNPSTEPELAAYYSFNQGIAAGNNAGLVLLKDLKGDNNGALNNFLLAGESSNYITQNSVLPLLWLSFTVHKQYNKTLLSWSTANEQSTKNFIVQRRIEGGSWKDFGEVAASGNSNVTVHYHFFDSAPASGINSYRILQTDLDGRTSYSAVRFVRFELEDRDFAVFQNPVNNGQLQVNVNRRVVLSLYTYGGNLVWQKPADTGIFLVNVSELAAGLYFIRTSAQTVKLVIQ